MVPHGFHRDYDLDFWVKRVGDIPPTLTTPLLPSLIGNIIHRERLESSREPPSFMTDGDQWGGVPTMSQASVPSPVKEKASMQSASEGEVPENEPPYQGESSQDQPPSEPGQRATPEVIIIDDGEDTSEETQGSSTLGSGQVQGQKQCLADKSPHPSPSEKQVKEEVKEGTPRREMTLPTRVKEEDVLPRRSEVYTMDHNWVQ